MELPRPEELTIRTLGEARLPSPLTGLGERFVEDSGTVLVPSTREELRPYLERGEEPPSFEPAGPRQRVFFDGPSTTCGLVTCGGLCPGLNDVIRAVVLTLWHRYGVRKILGFRYGYAGLSSNRFVEPLPLFPDTVEHLQDLGGTILGSSRGPQDLADMADYLERLGVNVLFTVGGDGTLSGAAALAQELRRRGAPLAVVAIPKTIDNDLVWVMRSFGFSTAVEEAGRVILAAHAEAHGAWDGVCLVKLMGRSSGFIAAHATLASSDVNICLVPEVPFTLEGFLAALDARLAERHHAVVVVAEGAGQELLARSAGATDASGNVRLADIGASLRDRISAHLESRGAEVNVRYIDPSYTIRSLASNAFDSEYCLALGQHAVHAAMAGKSEVMVGFWNGHFTHVPLALVAGKRRHLDPDGDTWSRVLAATGQPARM
jgi:6-phosphofructokinase 1